MNEKINYLILKSTKEKDKSRLNVLRSIKSEFLIYQSKGKDFILTESIEFDILRSMIKQREKSISEYKLAGKVDLVEKETLEISLIKEYLPKEPEKDELIKYLMICSGFSEGHILKKNMGLVIKQMKEKFPNASGKLISDIVKQYIKN